MAESKQTTCSSSLTCRQVESLPADVKPATLATIDLYNLQQGSETEQRALFEAAVQDGFFYLDLTHPSFNPLLENVDRVFQLSVSVFDQDIGIKSLFDVDKISSMKLNGYKPKGRNVVSKDGTRDGFESWVLPRNGILQLSKESFAHPPAIASERDTLESFFNGIGDASQTIFSALSSALSLRPGQRFEEFHEPSRPSPDCLRLLKYHPDNRRAFVPQTPHTDLGSLTFVFTTTPGLQVLPPSRAAAANGASEEEWVYVAPRAGHAIVNLGDCMTKMTNGLLKSSLHRVGPLPGRAMPERYSFACLLRPRNETPLRTLDSPLVPRAVLGTRGEDEDLTSGEWIRRKFKALRAGRDTAAPGRDEDRVLTGGRGVLV